MCAVGEPFGGITIPEGGSLGMPHLCQLRIGFHCRIEAVLVEQGQFASCHRAVESSCFLQKRHSFRDILITSRASTATLGKDNHGARVILVGRLLIPKHCLLKVLSGHLAPVFVGPAKVAHGIHVQLVGCSQVEFKRSHIVLRDPTALFMRLCKKVGCVCMISLEGSRPPPHGFIARSAVTAELPVS